jgi:hypothetical protein
VKTGKSPVETEQPTESNSNPTRSEKPMADTILPLVP